jgi:ketol-acid reductoisomerase
MVVIYLITQPLLTDFMKTIETNVIGKPFSSSNSAENTVLIVNKSIRKHPIEETGRG